MTPLLAVVASCPLLPPWVPPLTFGLIAACLWGGVALVDGVLPPPSALLERLRQREEE